MGAEKKSNELCSMISCSNRPPPVPPRPQHLIPVKMMSKYSSMPDILNGWKKDANPDLLKVNGGTTNTAQKCPITVIRCKDGSCGNGYSPLPLLVSNVNVNGCRSTFEKNVRKLSTLNCVSSNHSSCDSDNMYVARSNGDCGILDSRVGTKFPEQKIMNEKSTKKFSCIPSRSNSKKKKSFLSSISVSSNGSNSNNSNTSTSSCCSSNNNYCRSSKNTRNSRTEISQTNWYVEDIDCNEQVSKCEINLNCDNNNYRYNASCETPNISNTNSTYYNNLAHKSYRHHRLHRPPMTSSSLSGLPPLPKSLSDVSLLWEQSDKKLPYAVNLSPSSSNASSSSRSSGIHPKLLPSSSSTSSCSPTRKNSLPCNEPKQPPPPPPPHISKDLTSTNNNDRRSTPPPPPPRKPTSLDMKLAVLRKEMHDLRQMDLSLLSQLWSLNEAIHEFRQMQESLSSQTLSSHSSDEDDSECYYSNISSQSIVNSNQNHNVSGSSNSSRSSTSNNSRHNICENKKK